MNKKSFIKKSLSTVIVSTCAMVAVPVIANTIIENKNVSTIVNKQQNSSMINGQDANKNPNFSVTASLQGTFENDKGVYIKPSAIKSEPEIGGVKYKDLQFWEKSYDNGKTYTRVNANSWNQWEQNYVFLRENKEFKIRRVVDWFPVSSGWTNPSFTTNSDWITINKNVASKVVESLKTNQKADYRINLNNLNNENESIKFVVTKEYNGKQVTVDSTNGSFVKISEVNKIEKDSNGFFYNFKSISKQIEVEKYTFEYEITTNDKTTRKDKISFTTEALNKSFAINKATILKNTDKYVDIKVNFEEYALIKDYVISFIELDNNLQEVANKYVPETQDLGNRTIRIFKSNVDRKYAIRISSASLGSTITNYVDYLSISKESTIVNPNPGENTNPSLPEDNNNIVNSSKNSSASSSTIAILTIISLIALIAIICSIVLFINLRKNSKK